MTAPPAPDRSLTPVRQAPADVGAAPRPAINPALRLLWRSGESLQIGIDPRRAHVVDGLTPADEALLAGLDGSRTLDQAAAEAGCDPQRARTVVTALQRAGALTPGRCGELTAVPAQLQPDALAASLLRPGETGTTVILRRSLRRVEVVGAGRVGATLAALLAAAGVGAVRCHDDGPARPGDAAPGGFPAHSGGRRDHAAQRRVGSVQSQAGDGAGATGRPDLVILAPARPATPPEQAAAATGLPHLEVVIRETTAMIGPLVVPGRTACRRCAELARADRDPAWPLLSAQLASGPRRMDPVDLALASVAASLTALHALQWLDTGAGGQPHPLTGAIAEVSGRTGAVRRRVVHPHPDCGCGAAG